MTRKGDTRNIHVVLTIQYLIRYEGSVLMSEYVWFITYHKDNDYVS
jgi:hypothetical protein